jgi:hypothetical protein
LDTRALSGGAEAAPSGQSFASVENLLRQLRGQGRDPAAAPAADQSSAANDSGAALDPADAALTPSNPGQANTGQANPGHAAAMTAQTAPAGASAADRLAEARALLMAGDMDNARGELEAAAAQMVLQPTLPGQPVDTLGANVPAQEVNRALQMLDAGRTDEALALINAALSGMPAPSWSTQG